MEGTRPFYFSEFLCNVCYNQESASHIHRETAKENKQLKKHWHLIYTWSGKTFKGTVFNQALSSLHGESLEITLKIPLS